VAAANSYVRNTQVSMHTGGSAAVARLSLKLQGVSLP
jgi:hypothetical protein